MLVKLIFEISVLDFTSQHAYRYESYVSKVCVRKPTVYSETNILLFYNRIVFMTINQMIIKLVADYDRMIV